MKTGPSEPLHLPEYLPALDGLRGVAVLMVIAYHSLTVLRSASLGALFQVGWAGVDLFFVLSGFLITRILVQTRERGGYFRTFYARRALRIWPLYYLLLLFAFGVMGWLLPALAFDPQRYPWPRYALYLQNLGMTEFGPALLNVTWSLAIEEQFYLVWPLLVYFLRNGQLRVLLWTCVLLSPVARLAALWEGVTPLQVYTFTLFRLDGLALGGLLALGVVDGRATVDGLARWGGRLAVPALLVALGLSFAFFGEGAAIHMATALTGAGGPWGRALLVAGLYSLWALGFASLLGWVLSGRASLLQGVLQWRPLRFVGQVSYGLYLFHALVIPAGGYYTRPLFYRYIPSTFVATGLGILFEYAVLLALTVVSWRCFERPLLRLKDRFTHTGVPEKAVAPTA
ncbi:acyltransferase family protein [Corallococcus macrosporus]|uniref:Acyltransferase family protein n=1 Tax=Myxococcus fulvus (strain ATCC BAA-855 / HW-1) TaxID=483219 RepID=F8CQF6_MYXFH|nr:acyltransferase [Corallococcus macrosporus]AEI66688.1 acyltransferase family protein [Corallococcus macrosporus]